LCGPNREEVDNEELHNLCGSTNVIRVIKSRGVRPAGHVARIGEMRFVYGILVRKTEGKRPLVRSVLSWKFNNVMDLGERGWKFVEWIHLAQDMD
jgi:hypothetical protein